MDEASLEEFVEQTRAALDAAPTMSARTAEVRVTQQLLETLGWDVYSPAVEAGRDVDGVTVGFALLVGADPAVFVCTESPDGGSTDRAGDRLLAAMDAAGVPYGVVHDCHEFAFVVDGDDGRHRRHRSLAALPDEAAFLSQFTPDAVRERIRGPRPTDTARRLRKDRDGLVSDVADRIAESAGTDLDGCFETATRAFVDRLVERLERRADGAPVGGPPDAGAAARTDPEATAPRPAGRAPGDGTGREDVEEGDTEPEDRRTPVDVRDGGPDDADGANDRGQFVVRFFDDGTSVGAVGTSSPSTTLVQAVQFLEDGRGLLRGLSLPWAPGDEDRPSRAVVAREPSHPDGTEMTSFDTVSGGLVLWTGMDVAAQRDAIEALARTVGVRVMFQGDWDA